MFNHEKLPHVVHGTKKFLDDDVMCIRLERVYEGRDSCDDWVELLHVWGLFGLEWWLLNEVIFVSFIRIDDDFSMLKVSLKHNFSNPTILQLFSTNCVFPHFMIPLRVITMRKNWARYTLHHNCNVRLSKTICAKHGAQI